MKILIIGGTKFLGRHLVEAALSHGHQVTLFNRGTTNPGLFPRVEQLHGDRDKDLGVLKGRRWDAAIDTCGYTPAQVQATAGLLAGAVGHYTFISSVSAYQDFSKVGQDENARLATLPPGIDGRNNGEHYGAKKALCENEAESAISGQMLIIRPGIITGPHDFTKRFARWVLRIAQGGEVLCPAPPNAPLQLIDARDLARWTIHMVESRTVGCFNATGPASPTTFQQMLEQCKMAGGSDARFVWMDEKFLLSHNVKPSADLPLWIPQMENAYAGFFAVDCQRAIQAGLTFRPLSETAQDILNSERTTAHGSQIPTPPSLTLARETKILQMWKARAAHPEGMPESSRGLSDLPRRSEAKTGSDTPGKHPPYPAP